MRMPGRNSWTIASRSGLRDFREVAFRVLPWGSAAWPCVISFALVDWDLREPYVPILKQTLCQRKRTHNMLVLLDYLLHQQCGGKGNRQYFDGFASRTDRTTRASVSRSYGFWRKSSNPSGTVPGEVSSPSEVPEQRIVRREGRIARRRARVSTPSIPGMIRSRITRSTFSGAKRRISIPSSPQDADRVVYPSDRSTSHRRFRGISSSSTTRTVSVPRGTTVSGSRGSGDPPDSSMRGRRIWNVVPTPTLLTRRMNPPWLRTQLYTVESPRPVPSPGALVVKKGANISSRIASGIPLPESDTQMEAYRPSGTRTSFR